MYNVFMDALIDNLKMIPLLFIIYIIIEIIEIKYEKTLVKNVERAGKAGPLAGAGFGCIPQCGFSVISTALYTKRLITIGTLLAVYLSTSDEAIPIILSQPEKVHLILPIIAVKVIIAIVAGYGVDFIFHTKLKKNEAAADIDISDTKLCCGHTCGDEEDERLELHNSEKQTTELENTPQNAEAKNIDTQNTKVQSTETKKIKLEIKHILFHPLIHTIKVFFFIFIVSLAINFILFKIGDANIGKVFLNHSVFQPIIASLVGLIPNCGASVAITQVFLKGGISFGSAISGLCSSAGLGLLVLFKENKDIRDTLKVLLLLLAISMTAGILIQSIYG